MSVLDCFPNSVLSSSKRKNEQHQEAVDLLLDLWDALEEQPDNSRFRRNKKVTAEFLASAYEAWQQPDKAAEWNSVAAKLE